jgi:hypothetical protein
MHLLKIHLLLFFIVGILSQKTAAQGITRIKEDKSVSHMREQRKDARESSDYKMEGYWIFVQIFSNRKDAIGFQKEFNHRFSQHASCLIVYDEPNFKIYAGQFLLKAQAERQLSKVKQAYSTAKIIKMPLSEEFISSLK